MGIKMDILTMSTVQHKYMDRFDLGKILQSKMSLLAYVEIRF